jgi:hypothetical protein
METRSSVAAGWGCGGRQEVDCPSHLNPRTAQILRIEWVAEKLWKADHFTCRKSKLAARRPPAMNRS